MLFVAGKRAAVVEARLGKNGLDNFSSYGIFLSFLLR